MIHYIIYGEDSRVIQWGSAQDAQAVPSTSGTVVIVDELPEGVPSDFIYNNGLVKSPNEVFEAVKVRAKRDELLSNCDWTQAADVTIDKAAWATYRQDLRDITNQKGFPLSVVWPTTP